MKPEAYVGFGSLSNLGGVLARYGARSVFLVTGKRSFTTSGAEEALKPHLRELRVHRFCEFSENPKLEDVQSGVEAFRGAQGDVVVAVGGGSAIDMAKLINVYATEGVGRVTPGRPLIAIPTTAGSGSETTQFATVYVHGEKQSISGPALLPDVAIVDPRLTRSMPPSLAACSGMDALSQAIESYWSVGATDESKGYAREALRLILPSLRPAVLQPEDDARGAMAEGAYLAGRAINVSRTTAPHALSYSLTSRFGVPHGQAVGLTLPDLLVFNHAVSAEDVSDARGATDVRGRIEQVCELLGCGSAKDAASTLRHLMQDVGLATTFEGLKLDKQAAIAMMAREVNAERLANNPRRLDEAQVLQVLGGL